jgi:hypothetical protein
LSSGGNADIQNPAKRADKAAALMLDAIKGRGVRTPTDRAMFR